MPELPEVETVCRTLDPVLTGKRFVSFELLWPRTLAYPDETAFLRHIAGENVLGVHRRAKFIVIELSCRAAITIHLRMTGELLYRPSGAATGDFQDTIHLRAAFLFDDGSELLFRDVRKFGRISYFTHEQLSILNDELGIEPLDVSFTPEWLELNLRKRKRQLKPLLLDQTFIAGLGNIYVDESLFLASLHPLTRSDTIISAQAGELHRAIVHTLTGAVERRGTTLQDYRSGMGEPGENKSSLRIYGSRPGSPCPRCGVGLERLVIGQRGSIFCPSCQPISRASNTPSR